METSVQGRSSQQGPEVLGKVCRHANSPLLLGSGRRLPLFGAMGAVREQGVRNSP